MHQIKNDLSSKLCNYDWCLILREALNECLSVKDYKNSGVKTAIKLS